MNRKIILKIIAVAVTSFGVYQIFIKEPDYAPVLRKVIRGAVAEQTISETGVVEAAQNINLNFQNSGRITRVYVQVGDRVRVGQRLARIDTTQSEIQLTEAKAALSLTEARLNQLLAGATPEEIKSAEIAVSSAETALLSATQNLNNINSLAITSLNQAYKDALAILRTAYLHLDSALGNARTIQREYFTRFDQDGIQVQNSKIEIESALNKVNARIESAKDGSQDKIDIALSDTISSLSITVNALARIQDACERLSPCRDASGLRTVIGANRTTINSALTSVVSSQQNIVSTRLTNKSNINTAEARVSAAQEELQRAQNALSMRRANPRQVDLALHQAQIAQARARVNFIEEQIVESLLLSPIQGTVAVIHKQLGETAQVMNPIISIISADTLQIKVNIYEEDVMKISLNSPVAISPIALPDQIFKGKIVAISPIEKLIDGVVHYETTVIFAQETPREIKPGMTVDIMIQIGFRENVLIVPENALRYIGAEDKYTVRVFRNDLADGRDIIMIEYRDVEIGLIGEDDKVEIISGLTEGEQVVIE